MPFKACPRNFDCIVVAMNCEAGTTSRETRSEVVALTISDRTLRYLVNGLANSSDRVLAKSQQHETKRNGGRL